MLMAPTCIERFNYVLKTTGMSIAPLDLPTSPPISGWETISESDVARISQKIPCITDCLVYTYLCNKPAMTMERADFRN